MVYPHLCGGSAPLLYESPPLRQRTSIVFTRTSIVYTRTSIPLYSSAPLLYQSAPLQQRTSIVYPHLCDEQQLAIRDPYGKVRSRTTRDRFLTEDFMLHGYRKKQLRMLNTVRMYLEAVMLSDITNAK